MNDPRPTSAARNYLSEWANRLAKGDTYYAGKRLDVWDAAIAVLAELAAAERERDEWKQTSESWRVADVAWQRWAEDLLREHGLQPKHGLLGNGPAREAIANVCRERDSLKDEVARLREASCPHWTGELCAYCFAQRNAREVEEIRPGVHVVHGCPSVFDTPEGGGR